MTDLLLYEALLVARVRELLPALNPALVFGREGLADAEEAQARPRSVYVLYGGTSPQTGQLGGTLTQGLGGLRFVEQEWAIELHWLVGAGNAAPGPELAALLAGLAGWTPPSRPSDVIDFVDLPRREISPSFDAYSLLLRVSCAW